jgi:hypothetical protein
MRVWLTSIVAIAAGACSLPLVSQQEQGGWRYEVRGEKDRHFEIRLSFNGDELLHSDAGLARCLLAPGNNPLAAVCFASRPHGRDNPNPYGPYGRYAVFVRRSGGVERHDITANEVGMFSADGSAYLSGREVYDLATWQVQQLPTSLPELWPGTSTFPSPQFVGLSPGGRSLLWFTTTDHYEFYVTDVASGATLQSFWLAPVQFQLPYALEWQDALPALAARFKWTRTPGGAWTVARP